MKTITEIEKEYVEFKNTDSIIISADSLDVYIDFCLGELEHSRLDILKDTRSNYYAEKLAKAVDFVTL